MNLAQIQRIFFIPLRIARVIKVHQDAFVGQVSFQHTGAGERDAHRHCVFIHLKDGDVLEFVTFLFADVNFSPGKLINYLVASE